MAAGRGHDACPGGAIQQLVVGIHYAWMVVVAARLWVLAGSTGREAGPVEARWMRTGGAHHLGCDGRRVTWRTKGLDRRDPPPCPADAPPLLPRRRLAAWR